MTDYDNSGKGALWPNKAWNPDSKAPKWTGNLVAHRDIRAGETIPLSVWPNDRRQADTHPVMKLAVDLFKEQKSAPKKEPPGKYGAEEKDDFDDTIPFAFAFLAPAGLAVASAVYLLQPVVA